MRRLDLVEPAALVIVAVGGGDEPIAISLAQDLASLVELTSMYLSFKIIEQSF
jgi:hypothetical protein